MNRAPRRLQFWCVNTTALPIFDTALHKSASAACEAATVSCSGASMFTTDAAWDAELLMAISPNIKERVLEAQRRLQDDIKLRDLMDKHGIPRENTLRASIKATLKGYIADSVQRALRH